MTSLDATLCTGSYACGEAAWRTRAVAACAARLSAAGLPSSELASLLHAGRPAPPAPSPIEPYRRHLHAYAELLRANGCVPAHARAHRYASRFTLLGAYLMGALHGWSWRGSLLKAFEEPSLKLPALSDTGLSKVPRNHFLLAMSYALVRPASETLAEAALRAMMEDIFDAFDAGGSGSIDAREFSAGCALFRRRGALACDPEQLAAAWFAAYDGQAAGGLSPSDFLACLCTLTTTAEEVAAVAREVDAPALVAFCAGGAPLPGGMRRGSMLWRNFDPHGVAQAQAQTQLREALETHAVSASGSSGRRWACEEELEELASLGDEEEVPGGESTTALTHAAHPERRGAGVPPTHAPGSAADERAIACAAGAARRLALLQGAPPPRAGCIDAAGLHALFRCAPGLSQVLHEQRLARATPAMRAAFVARQAALAAARGAAEFRLARELVGLSRAAAWRSHALRRASLAGWRAWLRARAQTAALCRSLAAALALRRWRGIARAAASSRGREALARGSAALALCRRALGAWRRAASVAAAVEAVAAERADRLLRARTLGSCLWALQEAALSSRAARHCGERLSRRVLAGWGATAHASASERRGAAAAASDAALGLAALLLSREAAAAAGLERARLAAELAAYNDFLAAAERAAAAAAAAEWLRAASAAGRARAVLAAQSAMHLAARAEARAAAEARFTAEWDARAAAAGTAAAAARRAALRSKLGAAALAAESLRLAMDIDLGGVMSRAEAGVAALASLCAASVAAAVAEVDQARALAAAAATRERAAREIGRAARAWAARTAARAVCARLCCAPRILVGPEYD